MTDESIKNILLALYQDSSTIKMYVDAIAAGKPVPYTILTKSTDNERNEAIVKRAREMKEYASKEDTELLSILDEILDEEFTYLDEEYEVVMLINDTVVEGSRQVVTGIKIKELKQYAVFKGYELSARKIDA